MAASQLDEAASAFDLHGADRLPPRLSMQLGMLQHHSSVSVHGGCRHQLCTVRVLKCLGTVPGSCIWVPWLPCCVCDTSSWLLQVGAERYNLFQGCPKARTATMVLRGGSEQFIDEAERSLHDAIMIVRRALKNASVVAGGGAIDMEISRWGCIQYPAMSESWSHGFRVRMAVQMQVQQILSWGAEMAGACTRGRAVCWLWELL